MDVRERPAASTIKTKTATHAVAFLIFVPKQWYRTRVTGENPMYMDVQVPWKAGRRERPFGRDAKVPRSTWMCESGPPPPPIIAGNPFRHKAFMGYGLSQYPITYPI